MVALADAICKAGGLTELDVSSNSIGAAGAKAFSKSAMLLKRLDMSKNNLGGWPDKSGLKALGNCISVSTSLRELDLSANDLRGEDAAILAVGFGRNGAMETLDISDNPIRETGGEAMSRAIEINSALTCLNMGDHRMPSNVQKELRHLCVSKNITLKCGMSEDFHAMVAEKDECREKRTVKKLR
jgi:Leucine-rich repeat (LRR) protein